jgi:hypothetical protein
MNNLTETIGNLCNSLEDAVEEKDWDEVQRVTSELSEIYEELDKADYNY